jgi:hypothetical protein
MRADERAGRNFDKVFEAAEKAMRPDEEPYTFKLPNEWGSG